MEKVGTDSNIADPMTKHLARQKHESFLGGLGIFPAHKVVPEAYAVQKQEKLNVLRDITLVQAEDAHSVVAVIYGDEESKEQQSGWMFHMMLFWALVGVLRTALDVWRKLMKTIYNCPQKVANRVCVAEMGVGTSDVSTVIDSDDHRSAETTTVMRFTTVTRHAPIWHSVGGERFHTSANCRGLQGAMEIKQKTECKICGGGEVSSTFWTIADPVADGSDM